MQMLDVHEPALKGHFKRTLVYAYCLKGNDVFGDVKSRFCRLRKKGAGIEDALKEPWMKILTSQKYWKTILKKKMMIK